MTNFCGRNSCYCSARAAVRSYVITSYLGYLGSNRIFKIFNSKLSYDKMLIDWVRSGRTGKYLALGQEVRTSLCSVRPDLEPNSFPSGPPTQSISTYYFFTMWQNVPQKPRKLNIQTWVNYRLQRTKWNNMQQNVLYSTITANIWENNWKEKWRALVKI